MFDHLPDNDARREPRAAAELKSSRELALHVHHQLSYPYYTVEESSFVELMKRQPAFTPDQRKALYFNLSAHYASLQVIADNLTRVPPGQGDKCLDHVLQELRELLALVAGS